MSWRTAQQKLNSFGYELKEDGLPGPRTYSALFAYMGAKDTAPTFGAAAADHWPGYGLDVPLRAAHFLAQASEETGAFHYMTERWGPTPAQRSYEHRLGNTQPGDGYKYRGRGIFMVTGRANYSRLGSRFGLDLVNRPDLAATPVVALRLACAYWDDLKLNDYADADNILAVSNGINRGNPNSPTIPNGYEARKSFLARAKGVLA